MPATHPRIFSETRILGAYVSGGNGVERGNDGERASERESVVSARGKERREGEEGETFCSITGPGVDVPCGTLDS